jgi:hypothetical protein
LDPLQGDDPARRFLADRRLHLKKARSVLDNIRRYWNAPQPDETLIADPRPSADSIIARCKSEKNGRTIYAIPRHLLERVAASADWRRREAKRKAWVTRQNKSSV